MDDFLNDLNDGSMDDPFEDDDTMKAPFISPDNSFDGIQQGQHFTDNHETLGHQKNIVPDLKDAIKQDLGISTETDSNLNILAGENHSLGSSHFFGAVAPDQPLETAFSNLKAIHGDPSGDMQLWHQQENDNSCAIVCQEYIIESFTGEEISEEQLVNEAMEKGYYTHAGTQPDDVGRLLEDRGIPVERSHKNSIEDIIEKLKNNQKIFFPINSDSPLFS